MKNPHLLTILGNFWPRDYNWTPYPVTARHVPTEPGVEVLVHTQTPPRPQGQVVLIHGLEGAAEAGYMRSMAYGALRQGLVTHRFHMRSCGGTAHLCPTLYHAGLTSDLLTFVRQLPSTLPIFVVGFSLGGNVAMKLAGELGEEARSLLAGVCSVSTPIDLAASARRIDEPDNRLYQQRFVKRMIARILATGRYTADQLNGSNSIWQIDDHITAPSFGFGTAANYYATQSAHRFLHNIRIPALLIQAKDDTFIPFDSYHHPAFATNPNLQLIATEYGGHLGFIARRKPRFWADETVLGWIVKKM